MARTAAHGERRNDVYTCTVCTVLPIHCSPANNWSIPRKLCACAPARLWRLCTVVVSVFLCGGSLQVQTSYAAFGRCAPPETGYDLGRIRFVHARTGWRPHGDLQQRILEYKTGVGCLSSQELL